MPLPNYFEFSDVPSVQAEAERLACVMFGETWRETCTAGQDSMGFRAIKEDENMLSFSDESILIWKNGKLNDLHDGTPAEIQYYQDGVIKFLDHYVDDKLNDPPDGTPACVEYWKTGGIKYTSRNRDGKFRDLEDGSPSQIWYNKNGEITSAHSASNGLMTPEKAIELLEAAKVFRVAALLEKADQSVVPAGMPMPDNYANPGKPDIAKGGR